MFGLRALSWRRWCVLGGVLATVSIALLVALLALQPWSPSPQPRFLRATVAANGYECATIGRQILERNGSAVDAAIATLFCEGVGCAQCMGLGGGFLATIYDARSGRVRVLNARERAPAASTLHMFDQESSKVGGLSIAVPGELRGYGAMHREYGRLPWRELVQPTAELCRRGHRVSEYMGRVLHSYSDIIKSEPSMRMAYLNPLTGEVWNTGDSFTEPTLAQTLDAIAKEGPEAIHNGSLTLPLVRDIQKMGGIITEEDLRNYRVEWQEPIAIQLSEEHTLYTTPLPGSGSVLAFIINMLRGWSGSHYGKPVEVNKYWHRVIETFKYAYAKRTDLGDPSRSDLSYNMTEEVIPMKRQKEMQKILNDLAIEPWACNSYYLEMNMTNPEFAMAYRSKVDDQKTFTDYRHYGARFGGADDHGTAHVVVVAPDGSVVSVTSTINYIWGSQRRSRSLGIVLNNEMDDFAVPNKTSGYGMPPSPANMVGPGLQPLSSMVPSIVLAKNGRADLVIGAAGGTKITTQVALASLNIMVEGEDIHDSFVSPRLHHQLMPMHIEYETGFDMSIIESLNEKGHVTSERGPTAGFAAMVGAARLPNGKWKPQFDRRRVGSIDGF